MTLRVFPSIWSLRIIDVNYSLNVWQNSVKPIWSWIFLHWEIFDYWLYLCTNNWSVPIVPIFYFYGDFLKNIIFCLQKLEKINHERFDLDCGLVNCALKKVKVKSLSRVRLFAIPWTVVYQASLSMWFYRQEYWSGLPFPSPGDLPDPGIEPRSPALQADTLPSEPLKSHIITILGTAGQRLKSRMFHRYSSII